MIRGMTSWNEIRRAATAFSKRWKNAFDEKSQAQSFLKELLAVFGVDAVTVATFEHRVKFADGAYGRSFSSDSDRVAHLFSLYAERSGKVEELKSGKVREGGCSETAMRI